MDFKELDILFFNNNYQLKLEDQLASLKAKKEELLESGDAAALSDLDASISEKESSITRARHKSEELLESITPIAQSSARRREETARRGMLRKRSNLYTVLDWLHGQEMVDEDGRPMTALDWLISDYMIFEELFYSERFEDRY